MAPRHVVPCLAPYRRGARRVLGQPPSSESIAQVEREAPALGEDFAATSALHLMTAASLAREAGWEFFLETRI